LGWQPQTANFFPAANATDAPQPEGFLCKPCDENEQFYQVLQAMKH
jgi:hypothetical protein